MKFIRKRPSPPEFEAWKKAENPTNWDDLKNPPSNPEEGVVYFSKADLRKILLEDQRYICCYCEQRVDDSDKTVIEHLDPRNPSNEADKEKCRALMFEFSNLLAACDGGQHDKGRVNPRQLYCDKSKAEQAIPVSPLSESCESRFIFDLLGGISPVGSDVESDKTICILNLDTPKLRNLRSASIAGLLYKDPVAQVEFVSIDKMKEILAKMLDPQHEQPFEEFFTAKVSLLRLLSGSE